MALSNRDRVGRAMDTLAEGLKPFVEREMQGQYADTWRQVANQALPGSKELPAQLDVHACLSILVNHWESVFKKTLGRTERTYVHELRDVRNKWAHQEAFSTEDAYRALDTMHRLLTAIASPVADEIDVARWELMRIRMDEQARRDARKAPVIATEGAPKSGLQPWREIVMPHPDVSSGRYQQAEFAADLWQVWQRQGSDEYRDPVEFYRRTFLTEGLRRLLRQQLLRLVRGEGDPVITLQTNFGGGKTHSMLAAFHLFSGANPANLPGMDELLGELSIKELPQTRRVVLVGHKLSPGQVHEKADGTKVRTMWGELAWQLGGKEGYALVKESDERGTNPGPQLEILLKKYAPALILIDEWVAYARQLHDSPDMPGGTFDAHFTFAQNLAETVKAIPNVLLLVSLPESDQEAGGERGKEALARLKNLVGRTDSPWTPASAVESYEIVRRRLFQPLASEAYKSRDAVVQAFNDTYRAEADQFPSECREAEYMRKMRECYPIHPEFFERLYKDWSSLDRFQRTRGVLRLMAGIVYELWERQDRSLLVQPGTIPMDSPRVQSEFLKYLDDPWRPVIESDIDGPDAKPLTIDRDTPTLGRYSATRRVARAIFLGSAPGQGLSNKGIDDRRVKLACVQPGESPATFGDALRRLTDQATHLYADSGRYWYSTQPTVTRLAQDRATQISSDDVEEEISQRIKRDRNRGDFSGVHACPASSSDVLDETGTRLVILGPDSPHTKGDQKSPARDTAADILDWRGNSPRQYRNALVFLAADKSRFSDLEQGVRQYLSWKSIVNDSESLNLDTFQRNQAASKQKQADETVDSRVRESYFWLLVPKQDKNTTVVEWDEVKLQGSESLAVRASKKLRQANDLLVEMGGINLRMDLDRVPLWRGDHVEITQLADDYAKFLYLPKLRESEVLLGAVDQGVTSLSWQQDGFAYAIGWDEKAGRYLGLRAGEAIRASLSHGVMVVRPEIAAKQLEDTPATPPKSEPKPYPVGGNEPPYSPTKNGKGNLTPVPKPQRRFFGSVELDPVKLSRESGKVAEEVVQHLQGLLGAKVVITLDIQAEVPGGVPENVVRTVTENCRTLKFKTQGFEES